MRSSVDVRRLLSDRRHLTPPPPRQHDFAGRLLAIGKDAYLNGIATGEVDYHRWQPGPMQVRLFPGVAVLRYQAEVEITFRGNRLPRQRLWHTDVYELRGDRWQVVWSQATEIRAVWRQMETVAGNETHPRYGSLSHGTRAG